MRREAERLVKFVVICGCSETQKREHTPVFLRLWAAEHLVQTWSLEVEIDCDNRNLPGREQGRDMSKCGCATRATAKAIESHHRWRWQCVDPIDLSTGILTHHARK
ncbi:MAG: hypothetical protein AUK47_10875 [Deltaproteobacteria bacterium CG2_30_63_29]|nr:MAG: hypothetical protein AUK47_10875 [Deltaproteobacteria bacterium CG2_30_63_29]